MLNTGRIDAFIGMETVIDYLIRKHGLIGKFDKSVFRYEKDTPLYMAISKQSAFAAELDDFTRVMRMLSEDGTIETILKKYLKD